MSEKISNPDYEPKRVKFDLNQTQSSLKIKGIRSQFPRGQQRENLFTCKLKPVERETIPAELLPLLDEISSQEGSIVLNIHAFENELAPLLDVENTHFQKLTPETILTLLFRQFPQLKGTKFTLKGAAAVMPTEKDSQTGEVTVDIRVDGDEYQNFSLDAEGIRENIIMLTQRIHPNDANTILSQIGVYREPTESTPAPIVWEANVSNMTVSELNKAIELMGIREGYSVQILVVEGETQVQAIQNMPQENEDISEIISGFSKKTIKGPFIAHGIKTETPYTTNGHIHGYAVDNLQGGGHVISITGRIVIAVTPASRVEYFEYDPTIPAEKQILRDTEVVVSKTLSSPEQRQE